MFPASLPAPTIVGSYVSHQPGGRLVAFFRYLDDLVFSLFLRCLNLFFHSILAQETHAFRHGRNALLLFFLFIRLIYAIVIVMKLTVKVKLLPTSEQKASLIKTMEVFNEACNYISQIAWENKAFGQVKLHHLCYRFVRDTYGLSAQLTIRAIGKVKESYRAEKKTLHKFRKYSAVVYDQRILSFKGLDTVSILSVDGRFKIPIVYGEYAQLHRRLIRGQADMIYVRGNLFFCLCVEIPDGTPITPTGTFGVDFGLTNLATTSDGDNFSGKEVDQVRERMTKIKKELQRCGSKSAKSHLKKLSGKEARFKRNTNHIISKKIVSIAKDTSRAIALENLKGFNGRQTVRKAQRDRFGKWAFDQLKQFISYKAIIAGIQVIAVNPRNTSLTCSACGFVSKSNRKSQSTFSCVECGFTMNADLNASKNIALRASINKPIVVHSDTLYAPAHGTTNPLALAVGS